MALKIGDRVRENTSSTGVGGLSLTGAPAGFQRFSAILSSGDTTYYSLEENDKFEVGIGTYGSNNLERTTVLSSSNSGNKISLGGSGVVFITYPASKAIFNSETDQLVLGASGLLFANGTNVKDAKLVELTDVNLTGTPTDSSVVDLNITNKSLTIGDRTGAANSNNILIGYGAGSGITTSTDSVVIGAEASTKNKTGQHNVHIGAKAGPIASDAAISVYNSVALGYSAGNKMRHESVAIGYEAAKDAYEIGFVGIGYQVGNGLGSYSTIVGYQAGNSLGEDYAVAIGYQAGYNGAGESAVWIGQGAGTSSTGSTRSIGIGKNAGKSSSGTECIYIGEGAGTSNSSNNLVFVGNAIPSSNGTLIKGDMDSKRIAVGVADVTLDDTFFVGVNSANDEGIVVKGAASQVSNLTSWKNNSDTVLASVSKDGVVSAHEIVATGNGIQIADLVPASTTNKLYNDSGTLKFNGSAIGGGGGGGDVTTAQLNYVSGIAVYSSGVVTGGTPTFSGVVLARNTPGVTTDTLYNIGGALYFNGSQLASAGASSEAAYASGQAISNQSNITALNTASGIATSLLAVSGTATSLVASSGAATYASGQAIANESDIAALLTASGTATSLISTSGIANYASGQAVANEGDIVAVSGIAAYASGVSLTVKEADGSPNVSNVRTIVVSNGTLTDNGAGQVTVTTGGGGGGGDVTTSQLNYVSGIAVYSSGQAISNQGNITALLTASGTATSLIASSGIATYASGQAVANESDIAAVSGVAYNIFNIVSGNGSDYIIDGMGLGNAADPDIYLHKGHSYTFNKTFSGHPFRVSATEGGSVYQDADGNNIEIGSAAAEVRFEVPQNAPDKLHYYCTAHASNMKGVIYTTNNVDEIIHVSGIAAYASGQAISNQSNITALNTASGIATSLLAVSGTATSLVASSGIATYASGQAISNQSNVTALLTASGTATSLIASSGIATYASGNTANISFGSNAEGDILIHNGSKFTRLAKGTDDYILKMNGNLPNWEAESGGSSLTAGSGVVVDGASKINIHGGTGNLQEIQLTSDNIFTPKMIFTGSGVKDTPVTLKVLSSHGAVNTSGTALSFEGTQGQLFGITDNLSSGNIFSVADITGLPLISADASGDVKLGEYGRYVGVGTGVPLYGFDVSSSGQFQKGFVLSNYVPATTTNTLYNEGGTLKFNGAATYAPLLTASGAAVYASGQVNVSTDGTAEVSKALILDSAKSFTGTKHGVFNQFDSRVTASGVTIGASGITLTGGAYVQEAVPANDTPTTEDATITLDLLTGNYHNVVLGNNVTKFEFLNAKRGQRFILRITQHASSAKTIAWTDVDYTSGGAAGAVRWAGGGTAPTMSTATSHTDVYGFLCTNNAGSAFDGFVIGQDLPD